MVNNKRVDRFCLLLRMFLQPFFISCFISCNSFVVDRQDMLVSIVSLSFISLFLCVSIYCVSSSVKDSPFRCRIPNKKNQRMSEWARHQHVYRDNESVSLINSVYTTISRIVSCVCRSHTQFGDKRKEEHVQRRMLLQSLRRHFMRLDFLETARPEHDVSQKYLWMDSCAAVVTSVVTKRERERERDCIPESREDEVLGERLPCES